MNKNEKVFINYELSLKENIYVVRISEEEREKGSENLKKWLRSLQIWEES